MNNLGMPSLTAIEIAYRSLDIAEFFGWQWVHMPVSCHADELDDHFCLIHPNIIKARKYESFIKRPVDQTWGECWVPDYYLSNLAKHDLLQQIRNVPLKLRQRFMFHLNDTTNLVEAIKNRPAGSDLRVHTSFHLLAASPAQVAEAWWRTINNVTRVKHYLNAAPSGDESGDKEIMDRGPAIGTISAG